MRWEKKVVFAAYVKTEGVERPLVAEDLVEIIRSMPRQDVDALLDELLSVNHEPYPRFDHATVSPCTWASGKKGFRYSLAIELREGLIVEVPLKQKVFESLKGEIQDIRSQEAVAGQEQSQEE